MDEIPYQKIVSRMAQYDSLPQRLRDVLKEHDAVIKRIPNGYQIIAKNEEILRKVKADLEKIFGV